MSIHPDTVVMSIDFEGPSEYSATYTRPFHATTYDTHLMLELPELREGHYQITVTIETRKEPDGT